MSLEEFIDDITEEVKCVLSSNFTINKTATNYVPHNNDPTLTYENLDTKSKSCKQIETCVLFVDLRGSTMISDSHQAATLTKLYSIFISTMIRSAVFYGGHIRGIIGDRVMVVYDKENCFTNAVNTAVLMNRIVTKIIRKFFQGQPNLKCGIGIAHGSMLVAKTGIIRKGSELSNYKSLVWMGRTANIASKLTDLAAKTESNTKSLVSVGFKKIQPLNSLLNALNFNDNSDEWEWKDMEVHDFIDQFEKKYHPYPHWILKNSNILSFISTSKDDTVYNPPILMTRSVYNGFRSENSNSYLKHKKWKKVDLQISSCKEDIIGLHVKYEI